MTPQDLILQALTISRMTTQLLLQDIEDKDLLVRASPDTNHLAWQLGHLLVSEQRMMTGVGAVMPALPDGFEETYVQGTSAQDDPGRYENLETYRSLRESQRAATIAFIEKLETAKLSDPAPERIRHLFPTVSAVLMLASSHESFHAGQFSAIRRKLGKPVAF